MPLNTFVKIIKDGGFLDQQLTPTMLELIFNHTSVKPRGNKFIDFCQFDISLELIAEKRKEGKDKICKRLLDLTNPVLVGTKADYVRFHDDKSTYTGSHKFDRSALPGGSNMKGGAETTKPGSRMSSSRGRSRNSSRHKVMQKKCTSLEEPVADNRELYKKFGLGSKAGKCIRIVYAKEEVLYNRQQRSQQSRESPRVQPIRAPSSHGQPRRVASLPALSPTDEHGDNLLWSLRRCQFSHNPPKLWTSPFLQRMQEDFALSGTTLKSMHCLPRMDPSTPLSSPGRSLMAVPQP